MDIFGRYYRLSEETAARISRGEAAVKEYVLGGGASADSSCALNIHKSWQVIHFVLTSGCEAAGSDIVLSKAVLSDVFINNEDLGFGPAMITSRNEVERISSLLDEISKSDFRDMFDFQNMLRKDIYSVNKAESESVFFEYIWEHFNSVKNFYREAAASGQCAVFFLSSV